jgi:hypothetical protein
MQKQAPSTAAKVYASAGKVEMEPSEKGSALDHRSSCPTPTQVEGMLDATQYACMDVLGNDVSTRQAVPASQHGAEPQSHIQWCERGDSGYYARNISSALPEVHDAPT